jgi:ABC-type multidrug transport system permease subunit
LWPSSPLSPPSAVSSATYLCLAASRVAGSTLAIAIAIAIAITFAFVVLGSAFGGLLPGPFLPDWLALLHPVLPMGAAFTGIRDHVCFGGSHTLAAAVALITWAIVPICLAEIVTRLRHTS